MAAAMSLAKKVLAAKKLLAFSHQPLVSIRKPFTPNPSPSPARRGREQNKLFVTVYSSLWIGSKS
ncbi:MAG: hypothetical protein K8L97_05925, partial [Anaerolineae bacterium]|nr:hypothetical protein [Anaerolineae bacterium]